MILKYRVLILSIWTIICVNNLGYTQNLYELRALNLETQLSNPRIQAQFVNRSSDTIWIPKEELKYSPYFKLTIIDDSTDNSGGSGVSHHSYESGICPDEVKDWNDYYYRVLPKDSISFYLNLKEIGYYPQIEKWQVGTSHAYFIELNFPAAFSQKCPGIWSGWLLSNRASLTIK